MGDILGVVLFILLFVWVAGKLRKVALTELGIDDLPTWTHAFMMYAAVGIVMTVLGMVRLVLELFV